MDLANNGKHDELIKNQQYSEIVKRINVIDRELIRLIDAKKRYEAELLKLKSDIEETED